MSDNCYRNAVEMRLAEKQLKRGDASLVRIVAMTNENILSFAAGILTNVSVSFLFYLMSYKVSEHSKLYLLLYCFAFIISLALTGNLFLFIVEVITIAQRLTDEDKETYESKANALVDYATESISNIRSFWNKIIVFSIILVITIFLLFFVNNKP